jgi:hypothetical protein
MVKRNENKIVVIIMLVLIINVNSLFKHKASKFCEIFKKFYIYIYNIYLYIYAM